MQSFLTYDEWWKTVASKRKTSVAMDDINMLGFNAILYDDLSDEYKVDVKLKEKYHAGYNYFSQKHLMMMENTHLIHWTEWLGIGIIIKKHPDLKDKMMLVTHVDIVLDEPCFIDQPFDFNIKILIERIKRKKAEFTFLNRMRDWTIITVDFILMNAQIDVLEHYHEKHEKMC